MHSNNVSHLLICDGRCVSQIGDPDNNRFEVGNLVDVDQEGEHFGRSADLTDGAEDEPRTFEIGGQHEVTAQLSVDQSWLVKLEK